MYTETFCRDRGSDKKTFAGTGAVIKKLLPGQEMIGKPPDRTGDDKKPSCQNKGRNRETSEQRADDKQESLSSALFVMATRKIDIVLARMDI